MAFSRRDLLASAAGLSWIGPAAGWRFVGRTELGVDSADPDPAPRIARFESLAFGMFVHWGLYSGLGRGEWAMHLHRIPKPEYMARMKSFTARDFSGREIAKVAKSAGMKYVTLTSRHHDGFSLYDTRGLSPLDVTGTPAGRDLIADFCEGCRAEGIIPMLYCTTLDWSDPRFESDWDGYQQYLRDSVDLLCTHYGPIGGFWFDGNWSRKDADWQLDRLYAVIRAKQPEAMIINNTGLDRGGELVHEEIDSVTFERGRPTPIDRSKMKKYIAGEMCHTLNFHWGIATNDFNYLSPAHVIEELAVCRRAGANLLMNVGPDAEGRIRDYERAALARVGDWIALHGGDRGPMYAGRPAGIVGEERDFGLVTADATYLFAFDVTPTANSRHGEHSRGPGKRRFRNVDARFTNAEWLDGSGSVSITRDGDDCILDVGGYPYGTNTVVRVAKLVAGKSGS
jgi:alpha-L-fucosidase